jgi:hypothetical protein
VTNGRTETGAFVGVLTEVGEWAGHDVSERGSRVYREPATIQQAVDVTTTFTASLTETTAHVLTLPVTVTVAPGVAIVAASSALLGLTVTFGANLATEVTRAAVGHATPGIPWEQWAVGLPPSHHRVSLDVEAPFQPALFIEFILSPITELVLAEEDLFALIG